MITIEKILTHQKYNYYKEEPIETLKYKFLTHFSFESWFSSSPSFTGYHNLMVGVQIIITTTTCSAANKCRICNFHILISILMVCSFWPQHHRVQTQAIIHECKPNKFSWVFCLDVKAKVIVLPEGEAGDESTWSNPINGEMWTRQQENTL